MANQIADAGTTAHPHTAADEVGHVINTIGAYRLTESVTIADPRTNIITTADPLIVGGTNGPATDTVPIKGIVVRLAKKMAI